MQPEPQGSWLRTAVTLTCPVCEHVVPADRGTCEWCEAELDGPPSEVEPAHPAGSGAIRETPSPLRPVVAPAVAAYLATQPLPTPADLGARPALVPGSPDQLAPPGPLPTVATTPLIGPTPSSPMLAPLSALPLDQTGDGADLLQALTSGAAPPVVRPPPALSPKPVVLGPISLPTAPTAPTAPMIQPAGPARPVVPAALVEVVPVGPSPSTARPAPMAAVTPMPVLVEAPPALAGPMRIAPPPVLPGQTVTPATPVKSVIAGPVIAGPVVVGPVVVGPIAAPPGPAGLSSPTPITVPAAVGPQGPAKPTAGGGPGTLLALLMRPVLWPTGSSGRISGPGGS